MWSSLTVRDQVSHPDDCEGSRNYVEWTECAVQSVKPAEVHPVLSLPEGHSQEGI